MHDRSFADTAQASHQRDTLFSIKHGTQLIDNLVASHKTDLWADR